MRQCCLFLCILLTSVSIIPQVAHAQPKGYASRGVRAYLVNYSAIRGDRYLAELAARRFVLIDEAGAKDIPLMRAVRPDIPVLRYKDIVALHRSAAEYDSVTLDEHAFLHSSDPASLQYMLKGDSVTLAWMPDRRTLPVTGYELQWSEDSLLGWTTFASAPEAGEAVTVGLPSEAAYLRVQSVRDSGSTLRFSLPLRIGTNVRRDLLLWPQRCVVDRDADRVQLDIALRSFGVVVDSVFITGDWDRDNQLENAERVQLQHEQGEWTYAREIDITGLRTYCGYEYRAEAWSNGKVYRFPAEGSWQSNVNNRLVNNTYGFYVMNVGSPTWRDAYIEQVLLAFSARGYSGLFEDDCWYRVANYGVDAYPPAFYDDHTWRSGLYTMLADIQSAIAPRPAYFNGLHAETADSLLLFTEGGMTEGFAYTHWSGLVRGASWKNMCNRGLAAGRQGKTWMALGGAPYDDPEGRLYAMASYLLAADAGAMYANATDYQEFAHYPEFDLPIGNPVDAPVADIDSLAREMGGGTLHIREYSNGSVVVNAGNVPALYTEQAGRAFVVAHGGTTIDGGWLGMSGRSDSLAPGSARIYMHSTPPDIAFSPRIDSIVVQPRPLPSDGSTPCSIRVRAADPMAGYWGDQSKPLYIVVDAGAAGGPRQLVLTTGDPNAPEASAWYEGSFSVPVGSPPGELQLPVTAYSTTGMFTTGEAAVQIINGDSANLLLNYSFEIDNNDDGVPDFWHSYVKGFDYDTTGTNAHSGRRSVHVRNDSLTEFRGVSVLVEVNQGSPEKLELSGWSKAADVSGDANNDYSLYADITYTDGTRQYGRTAQFATGTHDWEYSSTVIEPEKPIRSINLYALFRRHTGEAWFDHLALRPYQEPNGVPPATAGDFAMELYPQPSHGPTHLRFTLPVPARLRIAVYDCLGRERQRLPVHDYGSGTQHAELPAGLPPGMYLLRLTGINIAHSRTFIVR
ncbi:hypothetical protein KQI65_02140 [bacterium]|nr:hypothetical protein [bacterium]